VASPIVRVAFATDGEQIAIKFWVSEESVLAASAQVGGTPEVWTDSCVEFFCSHAGLEPGQYFNFEFSCIGVLLTHFGVKGRNCVRIVCIFCVSTTCTPIQTIVRCSLTIVPARYQQSTNH
jgi:hypothetical protein